MSVPRSELVRWVRRYHEAERRIAAERKGRVVDPDEALTRALELMRLVEELGGADSGKDPPEEDRQAYETWSRLRRRLARAP